MQTNISGLRALGLIALALGLQACDPKSSSTSGPNGGPVPTSQMNIDLKVEAKDSSTSVVRANVTDSKATATSFRLDGGDFCRACVSGVCRSMADNDSLDSPDYIARFTFQPGVDHVVSFNRQEGQNAPDSRVILPPMFTVVTPANGTQVTDGQAVIFEWMPTGAPAHVTLDYTVSCATSTGASTANGKLGADTNSDGREIVSIDSILQAYKSNGGNGGIIPCDIDVSVHHELSGT